MNFLLFIVVSGVAVTDALPIQWWVPSWKTGVNYTALTLPVGDTVSFYFSSPTRSDDNFASKFLKFVPVDDYSSPIVNSSNYTHYTSKEAFDACKLEEYNDEDRPREAVESYTLTVLAGVNYYGSRSDDCGDQIVPVSNRTGRVRLVGGMKIMINGTDEGTEKLCSDRPAAWTYGNKTCKSFVTNADQFNYCLRFNPTGTDGQGGEAAGKARDACCTCGGGTLTMHAQLWLNGENYTAGLTKPVGDTVRFEWDGTDHDVQKFPDKSAYESCDFTEATVEATTGDFNRSWILPAAISMIAVGDGTNYYGSSVNNGSQCRNGMKIEITGTTSSPSSSPSTAPSIAPTPPTTGAPTTSPTTGAPTADPTAAPSTAPSADPTAAPSSAPTVTKAPVAAPVATTTSPSVDDGGNDSAGTANTIGLAASLLAVFVAVTGI